MQTTIGCLLITTNSRERLELLDQVIKSIESQNFGFSQKVLSIDIMSDRETVPIDYFYKYGWDIISGPASGMIYNQERGLLQITTDYVLYSEDKVIFNKIPDVDTLKNFEFICYNCHVVEDYTSPSLEILSYVNNINNYIILDDDVFLIKDELFKDSYYLNFPAVIAKTILFKKLHSYALRHYPNLAGEMGITKAWFDLKEKGKIVIYVKKDIFKHIPINLMDLFQMANIKYWNNSASLRVNSIVGSAKQSDPLCAKCLKQLEENEKKYA